MKREECHHLWLDYIVYGLVNYVADTPIETDLALLYSLVGDWIEIEIALKCECVTCSLFGESDKGTLGCFAGSESICICSGIG